MDRTLLVILCTCIGFAILQNHELKKEIRTLRKLGMRDMKAHQDWLFIQLYSMSPGKVLMPNEIEPENTGAPALIINRARDPMNEFNGQKNDWHGKKY